MEMGTETMGLGRVDSGRHLRLAAFEHRAV